MRRKLVAIFMLLLALLIPAGSFVAQAQEGRPSKIPNIVQAAIAQLGQGASAQRSSADVGALQVSSYSGLEPDTRVLRVNSNGDPQLEFHAAGEVGLAERADLEALGATVETITEGISGLPGLGIIVAWIPRSQVDAASALPWVVAVRPVEENEPDIGGFLSEGVPLHDADLAQAAGINGAGVTIGAISDGVTNRAAAQASGDLPAVINVITAGSGDEGTAMLEIIADMAPGAALAFHGRGSGTAGYITAANNLVTAGVDIIAEDIPFDAEPAFQKGAVAANGDSIAAAGVSVHSSAGNRGINHAARVLATPVVSPPDLASSTDCPFFNVSTGAAVVDIDPGPGTAFDVTLFGGTAANPSFSSYTLQWSEPRAIFPTAGLGGFTDLNLYIMNGAGTACLASGALSSTNVQSNGVGDTIEQVGIANSGAAVTVKIVVGHRGSSSAVAAPTLDLRWRGAFPVDVPTRAGSLNPDANYTGLANSAAASNAGPAIPGSCAALGPTPAGSTNPLTTPLECFSSGGPVQLFLTTVCPGLTPGPCAGVAGPPGLTAGAPDWTAADGVSVSGAGGFGFVNVVCPAGAQGDCLFFGTSASAPHAAGCDALVRQAYGGVGPPVIAVNAALAGTAVDRGPAGFDNSWGAGVLDCFKASRNKNVNALLSLDLCDGCFERHPTHFPNVYPIDVQFTNTSAASIIGPHFEVAILEGPGCPCTVGNALPAGALIPIAASGDGILSPGESFTHHFDINLTNHAQFDFFVNVFGIDP